MIWKLTLYGMTEPDPFLTEAQDLAGERRWVSEDDEPGPFTVLSFRSEGDTAIITSNAVLHLAEIVEHFCARVTFNRLTLEQNPPTQEDIRATERFLAAASETGPDLGPTGASHWEG